MFESVPVGAVIRYRAGVRGPKPATAPVSKLINCDRPSQLKLDGDSRAFDSSIQPFGPLDRLAVHGIVPTMVKVTVLPCLPVYEAGPKQYKLGEHSVIRWVHPSFHSVSQAVEAIERELPHE